ncbi:MAG: Rieske 2Fe-2S domain-containing protein [Deltaproteobacteria bacterium]|nr:Rieske 2Fe-2S domain-containing protein [Deltaproteobacteria bacterium]
MTVAKVKDVPKGKMIQVQVNGKDILLANVDGTIYAIENICSHAGGFLHEGCLDGSTVECPLHAAQFSVTTGKVSDDTPWAHDQPSYPVTIVGDDVCVEVSR